MSFTARDGLHLLFYLDFSSLTAPECAYIQGFWDNGQFNEFNDDLIVKTGILFGQSILFNDAYLRVLDAETQKFKGQPLVAIRQIKYESRVERTELLKRMQQGENIVHIVTHENPHTFLTDNGNEPDLSYSYHKLMSKINY